MAAAIAAVEATAALASALPPGAACAARHAISAGLLARRTLAPLLRSAAAALAAAVKPLDVVSTGGGGGESSIGRARFSASAARDLELDAVAAADPASLVPSAAAVRAALLGGLSVELVSDEESAAAAAAAAGAGAGPLAGVGSLMPLPPLPAWLLAACSPRSGVDGWGAEGAAAGLCVMLGLEAAGSPVTRGMTAEAKIAAVSGIFCLGQGVWGNPTVAAPAAALTDIYWGRLSDTEAATAANPSAGCHAYGAGSGADVLGGDTAAEEMSAAATGAAGAAEALCQAFANDSFGDALFARHAALQLRAGAPPRARAAAWLALHEGCALHLLPPMTALAPRPDRDDALLFLPPGGEADPQVLDLYLKALESGALDRCLVGRCRLTLSKLS